MANAAMQPSESEPQIIRPDGRFFYAYAQGFLRNHEDLLPKGYGMVHQAYEPIRALAFNAPAEEVAQRFEEMDQPPVPHETVLFDARRKDEGTYSWQYTRAIFGQGMAVRHIDIHESGDIRSWGSTYYPSGQLRNQGDLSVGDLIDTLRRIHELVTSSEAQQEIEELRQRRVKAQQDLERFATTREVIVALHAEEIGKQTEVIDRYTSKKKVLVNMRMVEEDENWVQIKVRLRDDTEDSPPRHFSDNPLKLSFKKELGNKQKYLAGLGFATLGFRNKPT